MILKTAKSINFVFEHTTQKWEFYFWMIIRLISAVLPLVTIYQFSHLLKLVETQADFNTTISYLALIFLVRIIDNFLRIRSSTRLDFLISNISFDIHNYFLIDFNPLSQVDRHTSIQAIRNFADATIKTLTLLKQPGLDSLVSLIFIPVVLFILDFKSFVIILTYIVIYTLINFFTSQHYKELRDIQNTKTETYFAKLQENNDVELEQSTFTRHFQRLTNWNFIEWFALQNTAVTFYTLFLFYQTYLVAIGTSHISDMVLIIGYVTQTQTFLNSFTDIWYGLGDMYVAFKHLAKNESVSAVTLEDLI